MWKPGDKFKRIKKHATHDFSPDKIFTVKSVPGQYVVCTGRHCHNLDNIVKYDETLDTDVQQLVDDVTAGRIQRGGVQGKFVVYLNDAGDTVIQLFKQKD